MINQTYSSKQKELEIMNIDQNSVDTAVSIDQLDSLKRDREDIMQKYAQNEEQVKSLQESLVRVEQTQKSTESQDQLIQVLRQKTI